MTKYFRNRKRTNDINFSMRQDTTPIILLFSVLFVLLINASCKKYLDAKPDRSLAVPSKLEDFKAMLDHASLMNTSYSAFDEVSADDYYLSVDNYNGMPPETQRAYKWENFEYTQFPNDWSIIYDVVNVANIVLEGIGKLTPSAHGQLEWNNIKGSALVFRSQGFLRAAWTFANAYDESTASQDLGISLRLTSDFNVSSKRSNLKDTYEKIIGDLKEAATLLPEQPMHPFQPSKAAAYAYLARTYLSMRMYDSCEVYANYYLQIKNQLMDFNTLPNLGTIQPFEQFNSEVIFSTTVGQYVYPSVAPTIAYVDSILFRSYDDHDLRKRAFFEPMTSTDYWFKGTYDGQIFELFTGIATDEIYLMRSESRARLGNKDGALSDLNTLLQNRWETGFFIPATASTAQEALTMILAERRKELVFRGLRWMDIKRLNKEGHNIIPKRSINGDVFELQPNAKKYALPLPKPVVDISGMPQNPY